MRASAILPAGSWDRTAAVDQVTLDHDQRHRRRMQYVADGGTAFLLDLPNAKVLADGDGLVLDGGGAVAVIAKAEPLMEVRAADAGALMRLAWHIGNRHLAAELGAGFIRLRRDHVIEAMLRGLGGQVIAIEAPFNPETGAYAGGGHGHAHGEHDHAH